MKNFINTIVLLASAAVLTAACANNPKTSDTQAPAAVADISDVQPPPAADDFSGIQDRDWNLAEIRIGQDRIVIDRAVWEEADFQNNFTLRFDAELASGTGAPNRYNAPYSLGAENGISIGMIVGTKMASFREPEELKEQEYFALLQKVTKWNLTGKNLDLHTKNEDGAEAVLVFVPAK
jgi:heat shock protein HslJ